MKWISLITFLVKGVVGVINYLREKNLIDAGYAKAITESLTTARKQSEHAAKIRKEVGDMPANQLLDELRNITRED